MSSETVDSRSQSLSRPIPRRRPRGPNGPPEASEGLRGQRMLSALTRLKKGDFSVRLGSDFGGVDSQIAEAFDDVVELNQRMSLERSRLCQLVGTEGRSAVRAS